MDAKNNFKTIQIGINLTASGANIALYDEINKLAPFGSANKKPHLHSIYVVEQVRLVGSDASHLRLQLIDSAGGKHTAIGFSMASAYRWLETGQTIELVFALSENIWQNRRNHQLEIIDIKLYEH
jgi:single-stranded-DNA-specific exonuclease